MKKKVALPQMILIITTTVFSFSSMMTAFYMLGSRSLVWFLISAFFYFTPYAIIVAQYTKKYADRSGSIYDWLKDSLSPRIAFITIFLWYSSYFIWMISLFMKLTIPLSILIFGKDMSASIQWFGLSSQFWLSAIAIIFVLLLTFLVNQGVGTVFSFLKLGGYTMIGLFLLTVVVNLFLIQKDPAQAADNLQHSFRITSFFSGTSDTFLSQLPFFIFSITAFGGLDTIASLADKTKKGTKIFPKAVIIGSVFILLFYFSGIILWSCAHDIQYLRDVGQLHLGNLMYGLMESLGKSLALALNLSTSASYLLTQIFVRYTAFTMFIAYLSLLSSISYGPMKSLIQGTPQILKSGLATLNRKKIPAKALWLQALGICLFIGMLSLQKSFIADLFNQLTYMTNVSRAIPYFIVAMSFPSFLKKRLIQKEELLVADYSFNYFFSLSVCLCIFAAVIFQIYESLKLGNYKNFFTLLIGPVAFGILAAIIFQLTEKKAALPDN